MDIGNTVVVTPYDDDPAAPYAPDWRHQVVAAINASPNVIVTDDAILDDPYIRLCRDVTARLGRLGYSNKRFRGYHFAQARYRESQPNDMKHKLECLLLTNASLEAIAEDLDPRVTPEDVKTYERLYFNIRDDKGEPVNSCYLRHRLAMPGSQIITAQTPLTVLWRIIAVQFGYGSLAKIWGWRERHQDVDDTFFNSECQRLAQVTMLYRLLRGEINNFDIVGYLGYYVAQAKQRSEASQVEGQTKRTNTDDFVLELLQEMRPTVLSSAMTVDEEKETMKLLTAKIAAQQAVEGQQIRDAGILASEEALRKAMSIRDEREGGNHG